MQTATTTKVLYNHLIPIMHTIYYYSSNLSFSYLPSLYFESEYSTFSVVHHFLYACHSIRSFYPVEDTIFLRRHKHAQSTEVFFSGYFLGIHCNSLDQLLSIILHHCLTTLDFSHCSHPASNNSILFSLATACLLQSLQIFTPYRWSIDSMQVHFPDCCLQEVFVLPESEKWMENARLRWSV
jgi:hypothetical protein